MAASVAVTVTGAAGPIAGAAVRLAPEAGDVIVLRTGADGVARADKLEPGEWLISASAADHEPNALAPQQLAPGAEAKLALVLARGGRLLGGTVTDVSGGPIAGARIDAARVAFGRPDRAIATAITGADGKYQVTVPEGRHAVAARSPDYAPQVRHVEVGAAGATADFALVPGGAIEGVVLDEKTRDPVPGAAVLAKRERGGAAPFGEGGGHRGVAGPDGKFRLTGLRPGAYELGAGADARFTKAPTIVGLGVAEQVAGVELLLGTGPVVRGTVVDEANAPVAGAEVRALGRGAGRQQAITDAKGAFVLEQLPPGSVHLIATAARHVAGPPSPVEVREQDVDGVVVRVRRGAGIKGHVEPRQVAEIRFEPDERPGRGGPGGPMMMMSLAAPIRTGPDGEFELPAVPPGPGTVIARCPSGEQGSVEVEAAAPGPTEVVVKVAAGASIAGRVTDTEGKPAAGVTVMAAATGGVERTVLVNGVVTSGAQAITGENGAYEIRGLAAGGYRVSALDRGGPARTRSAPPKVTLAEKEKKTGVDLAIERANGVIRGVVLGGDGKPLADAWVSAQLDLAGMLENLTGGREPGEGGGRMIAVEARNEGDGLGDGDGPLGGSTETAPALTDAQGRFELRGLVRAPYEVLAEAQAGKLRGRSRAVRPDATVTITATGLSTLSGTVRGPKGPVALFTVELDGPTRAQRTFTGGAFELGRVDPGAYTVRVRSDEGNGEAKVEVAANTPATVAITLIANAVVVGTVVDAAGQPLAGIPVTVVDASGGRITINIDGPPPTTGPDGRFRIEHEAGPAALIVLTGARPIVKPGLVLEAGKTFDAGTVRVEPPGPAPGSGAGSGSGSNAPRTAPPATAPPRAPLVSQAR